MEEKKELKICSIKWSTKLIYQQQPKVIIWENIKVMSKAKMAHDEFSFFFYYNFVLFNSS